MTGEILQGRDVTADVDRTADVCIIGSGAGGGVLAARLVAAGLDVVMLEAGGHYTRRDFDLDEAKAYPMLYQERGVRSTADQSMTMLQGRSVGGSTTVNWTTCFRTPPRILDHWRSVHGVEGWDPQTLQPHFEAVEARLNIRKWDMPPNRTNSVLAQGCEALGWHHAVNTRNVLGCLNSGYCGVGCPAGAKQAMGVTYIADAVAGGLTVYANTQAERIETEGARVVAVHGRILHPDSDHAGTGVRVTIRPKVCVSSAGAVNGPALLLRSGLGGPHVGKRTFLHPVVAMGGEYAERVDGWYGAPQSVTSHEHIDRGPDKYGMFLEAAPLHPVLTAGSYRSFYDIHTAAMSAMSHTAPLIALLVDGLIPGDEGGTVTLRSDGRVRVDYPFSAQLVDDMREAHALLARVHLAAGATRISSLHNVPVVLTEQADLAALRGAPYGANEHTVFSAHAMGGCGMGSDPETSVVDSRLQVHGMDNLFVVDGSVLPTSLGVNPSQTIYGIAHRASGFIASAV